MIETSGISKRFGSRVAVDGIDLRVESGTSAALFGPNGAGKTTLLRMLSSGLRPNRGSIRIGGRNYREHPGEIRAVTGVISHSSHLYDDLGARDNLLFFARLHGVKDPARAADRLLESMGLAERAEDPVRTFSRGMVQRLAIARSLVHDPEVVYLDEPFSGLDPGAAVQLRTVIGDLRRRRRTLVMATHDLERGLELSDRWIVMNRGRIVEQGPSDGADARGIERDHFGGARPAPPGAGSGS